MKCLDDGALNIGDQVTLENRSVGVCASVGSTGTVLSGSDPHVVTFELTTDPVTGEPLGKVVTLTQDGVPRCDLRFEGEAPEDEGDEKDEEDEEEEEEEEEEEDDEMDVNTEEYHVSSEVLSSLRSVLKPDVYSYVTMILNLEELGELVELLNDNPDVDVEDVDAVLNML